MSTWRHDLAALAGFNLSLLACGSGTESSRGDASAGAASSADGGGGAASGGSPGSAGALAASGGALGGAGAGNAGGAGGAGAPSGAVGGSAGAATSGGSPSSGGAGASGAPDEAGAAGMTGGTEPLEPVEGSYGQRRALPDANSEMAVAEVNGKIYVLGGYPSSRVVQSTFQVYDIASDSWSKAAPYPVTIHHPVLVGVGGKVYSIGGQTSLQGAADTARALAYDPSSDVWAELSPMPTARGAGAAAVIDDQVYVVGGRPPAGNAFEVYDISDNAWTELPDLPQAFADRNHLAAAALGGRVYVAGGRYNGGSFSDPITASLDIFDPQTRTWSAGAPMLRPRGGVNGIAARGCFFVWGGEGTGTGEANDVFPDHDVYNPRTNTWTRLPPLPTPVHGVTGAAFVDGLIYMPGGGTRSGGSSGSPIFQVYRPAVACE